MLWLLWLVSRRSMRVRCSDDVSESNINVAKLLEE
jgi:hypothetical protein